MRGRLEEVDGGIEHTKKSMCVCVGKCDLGGCLYILEEGVQSDFSACGLDQNEAELRTGLRIHCLDIASFYCPFSLLSF